jgi:predicted PurR-regulated permease PerM
MRYFHLEPSTKIILKVVFVILALVFLWFIRDVVIILLLAIVLASAMEPLVDYFRQRRIPRAVSVLAVYLLVLGLVALIVSLLVSPVATELKNLEVNLPGLIAQLHEKVPYADFIIGDAGLGDLTRQVLLIASGEGTLLSRTVGVFNGVFTLLTVLVISFYLVAEEKGMKKFIGMLVPADQQDFTWQLMTKIQHKMGMWVLGQIILSFSIFLLTFIGLSILGVKYALFLALLAGLLEVVPYIGPFVSAIPAVFFALIQSPALVVAVIILYVIIQKTEGYVLVPKIMEKTVGTSPLVVLLALLIGFKLAGIFGLLLAVPLVSAVTVIIQELSNHPSRIESG